MTSHYLASLDAHQGPAELSFDMASLFPRGSHNQFNIDDIEQLEQVGMLYCVMTFCCFRNDTIPDNCLWFYTTY